MAGGEIRRREEPGARCARQFKADTLNVGNAGPVLHWMIGKPYHEVSRYIERKGWRVVWG
jgi:hypothetical protein